MIQIIPEKNDKHTLFKYIPNFLDEKSLNKITKYLEDTNDWKSGISHNGNNIKRQQPLLSNHRF